MTTITDSVIAVSETELNQFGCPYCGYRSGYVSLSGRGTAVWRCGDSECGKTCCVLARGIRRSRIGLGDLYPKLQPHPRRGIPSHGTLDKKPDSGGEFFRSRGIGLDTAPGCFVCGGEQSVYHNIAAFVKCKEAGERVVSLFMYGAWLDYRKFEPDRIQVKIGACDRHRPNLQKLDDLAGDGIITAAYISQARDC